MDDNNNIKRSPNVPPFVRYCSAIIPTMFDDSLSYYEALCALNNFLQKNVIEVINNNAAVTEKYIKLANDLKDYVENYFANLDVQEEINNKLDAMAEDGTLDNIILNYLQMNPMITFDTLADAQASEQLIEGSTFKTLGKETLNDGFGAIYKVGTEETDIALQDSLYASVVDDFGGNNYYNEITTYMSRSYNSDYYVATVPLNDSEGNMIPLNIYEDTTETTTPLTYAEANYTTLTTNCGLTRQNTSDQWKQGAIISNGVALHGDLCDIQAPAYMSYICFKADRSVIDMPASSTTDVMLAQGVTNAWLTFGQMIKNGVIDMPADWGDLDTVYEPRFTVGVKLDGTIVIVGNDGRTSLNKGMSLNQNASLMLSLGCVNAWRCDGGGSTSIIYKGSKQNRNIDSAGTADRTIYVTLNFKKQTIDKELAKVYSTIGKERQLLNKQIRQDSDATYSTQKQENFYFNWQSGYNQIVDADTSIRLQHQDGLAHHNSKHFSSIKNASNRTIGITAHSKGIYRIDYCIGISNATVDGNRQVRIETPTEGTLLNNNRGFFNSYIDATQSSDVHELIGTIIFNNSTEDTNYYFAVKGPAGDDFARSYTSVTYIGTVS